MPLTLHDAFVPSCIQGLKGLKGVIDKADSHVAEQGITDAELIEAQLHETMWKLPWHIRSCWMHSAYTLEQVPSGEFTPDFTSLPEDWAGMHAMIDDAIERLEDADADRLEAIADETVFFVLGGKRLMEFTVQDFLLGFNRPNFSFHAATFYDILRMKGVPLVKRDYLGPMPMSPVG